MLARTTSTRAPAPLRSSELPLPSAWLRPLLDCRSLHPLQGVRADVVCFNVLLAAETDPLAARSLMAAMRAADVAPDERSFCAVLQCLSQSPGGLQGEGRSRPGGEGGGGLGVRVRGWVEDFQGTRPGTIHINNKYDLG